MKITPKRRGLATLENVTADLRERGVTEADILAAVRRGMASGPLDDPAYCYGCDRWGALRGLSRSACMAILDRIDLIGVGEVALCGNCLDNPPGWSGGADEPLEPRLRTPVGAT